MAGSGSVWGIEIGQSALKALRCSMAGGEVIAEAFDYVEYPKILSQPEADADALVADALAQLLERNDAHSGKVCISVPGQSGLAKFFKPPPVEVKKVADIVRYEARQQIPFDLADVVWDHQMMPGSMIEEGFAVESEVGLFAMKREQAYRQLAPFDKVDLEVDIVQLAPIALYNTVAYDRMHERVENDIFDPDDPPKSTVILSIGTDSSDLIVTNGFRIWQRSMPIGGNHFTRQLTKDLKLTFAKAEHLKRNAKDAADPKLVFQTMRPVFNDLVTEVQRSIGFFRSIDRKAEIGELLITGNTVKMPGLAAYLGKNLGFDVHVLDRFNRLSGEDVLSIPQFRDNAPTFAVCYGLCLQGLGVGQVHASLVPHEILRERMIRAKKPWVLAGLAALLVGLGAHYWFTERTWASTHEDLWKNASFEVTQMDTHSTRQFNRDAELTNKLNFLNEVGKELSGNVERRLTWLEIIRVVNKSVYREDYPDDKEPSAAELPLDERRDIHITAVDTKFYEDLSEWYDEDRKPRFIDEMRNWRRIMDREEIPYADLFETGPTESGWVIQLKGYHYFNSDKHITEGGNTHVRKNMTTYFLEGKYQLPGEDGQLMEFSPEELGLSFPLLLDENKAKPEMLPNPDFDRTAAMADPENYDVPPQIEVGKLDFTYQIVWKPNLLTDRLEARAEAEKAAAEAAAAQGDLEPDDEQTLTNLAP